MNSREIRQKFLDFYKGRGHVVIPSASLIPENDSTLLFVNSGMFPLVPYLLGESHPSGVRLVNSQKSFRSEDIEEVGDSRHDTLFEMLGNWSLGDYFKEEQLHWWYEFLVDGLKIDPKRLYQTVYVGDPAIGAEKDEESISIIRDIFKEYGIDAEEGEETVGKGAVGPGVPIDFSRVRIMAYRDKNWWKRGDAIGELGGPDSETFYDTGRPHDQKFGEHCHLNCDCGRFIEIGNSVFMQYKKTAGGWEEIKNKNVDFGGGLERILMAENEITNIFETDLFAPIIDRLEVLSGRRYGDDMRSFEIVADHLKAAAFLIGDDKGIVPSNVGQGYIVRRLIRRAVRYGRQLGITESGWMKTVLPTVLDIYAGVYPELERNFGFISVELDKEEEKFARSLENGIKEFDKMAGKGNISGKEAFYLYQSYGLPKEDIEELCGQKGISFDGSGFDEELKKHQDLSRTASAGMFKGGLADSSEETTRLHTAAHLMLAALRAVLGDHVLQKGSNITAERLRFDFSHPTKMTDEEIEKVEDLVNGWIRSDLPVIVDEMDIDEAKKTGAMGVFDDRYGDRVKVYTIGDGKVSIEICGGPHVSKTSEIGDFKIIKEESASSGIRRIKAITIK
ncbi:MAG: alanine--tRNA ligase-related protein [Candidatus Colwellbacteria bacterium]|nr:alanine--tRNA ligase-related protein [Candidatus Colwellbacteria bacterium]